MSPPPVKTLTGSGPPPVGTPRGGTICFRCNRQDHYAAEHVTVPSDAPPYPTSMYYGGIWLQETPHGSGGHFLGQSSRGSTMLESFP